MELSKLLTLVLIFPFPSRVKVRIPTSMGKDECTPEKKTQKDVMNVSSMNVKVKMRGWELVEI